MITPVLAVNPVLEMAGLISAILIGLFLLISILLGLIVALLSTFITGWLEEKTQLLKLLRPNVESITEAHQAIQRGEELGEEQSALIRVVAGMPERMKSIDQKVERTSDRIAETVIELRARTLQVKTVVKAFLLPGLMRRATINDRENDPENAENRRSAYRRLMTEAEEAAHVEYVEVGTQNGELAEQHKDVPVH